MAVTDRYAQVLLDVPIAPAFDYRIPDDLAVNPGDWVVVPWGRARRVGVVRELSQEPAIAADRVRDLVSRIDDAPALPASWFALGAFASGYYHRQPGEVLMPAIPKLLRVPPRGPSEKTGRVPASAFTRAEKKYGASGSAASISDLPPQTQSSTSATEPVLTDDQQSVWQQLQAQQGFQVSLLHGVTGSGKTEVYLRCLNQWLSQSETSQVLLLVPEIALTPQLAERVRSRLRQPVAVLHSAMAEGERAAQWLAAVQGRARIVIGTRLSVLVPLPALAGIVVDEEHDPSFRQQESPHYSARDLSIVRAREHQIPVILGSATPSLESWQAARSGRYVYLPMTQRATGAPMPEIEVHTLRSASRGPTVSTATQPDLQADGFCPESIEAIEASLQAQEQTLVFLNRRGYAPVLNCNHCDWLSECDHCSAYRVLHRGSTDRHYRLICHHCATESAVPRACPVCGDLGLQPLGRGTQRVEELLAERFPDARIGRLDRDVARRRGAADAMLDSIHRGDIDIVVGTQMLAKGHDFRRLNLVVVLDADGALFSSDFRAPERLYATLTQVAGRAGRNLADGRAGRVIVQTRFPEHALFASLKANDYTGFANDQLVEREQASLPPFSFHVLLRLDATDLNKAIAFGRQAGEFGKQLISQSTGLNAVRVYDPVPMPLAKVAGRSRAQLLVESDSRLQLHHFIRHWTVQIATIKSPVRWQLEIDPAQI